MSKRSLPFHIRRTLSRVLGLSGRSALRLAREDRGTALVFTIAVFLFLFVLVLSVYSVGETIRRKTELQNACDAAAYSAAVVQADALSRMALVNRAMAWSYIQMTKAELDYYTFLWLERVRESYAWDSEKCLKKFTGLLPPTDHTCGWWHSKYNPLHLARFVPILNPFEPAVYRFGMDCHKHFHDNPNNRKIRWIGLGPGPEEYNRIRIGYTSGGQLEYANGDLCIPGSSEGLVSSLQNSFGKHGLELRKVIDGYHRSIANCNKLLEEIADKMTKSIPETVRRTLLENLPRTESGEVDESILDQYRWMSFGGISGPPADYDAEDAESGGDGSVPDDVSAKSFFSGARNVEEDELRFLNMAGGVPEVRTGPNGTATLKDWFADSDSALSEVRNMAGGLDQWFIRCRREEMRNSDEISVNRTPQFAISGIARHYKNANYDEGRSDGSILGSVAGKYNVNVHRGNHILPSISDAISFDSLGFSALMKIPPLKLKKPPKWPKSRRKAWKRINARIQSVWRSIVGKALEIVTSPLNGLLNALRQQISQYLDLDIDPSCKNSQSAFADQCSNVEETHGLVAEYEWKTAAWVCGWVERNGSKKVCFHIPVPFGLLNGTNAKDHYTNGGLFAGFPWLRDEIKNFTGQKGFSRNDYRATFVGLDTARPIGGCNGENQILRAYTRVYGDDRWDDDRGISRNFTECKVCGAKNGHFIQDKVPAKPWFLNERFFEGQGTIVVAIAKEQRNVFDWLADAASLDAGLHAPFSPAGAGEKPGYYVAISAGRAGPARRTGTGRADGPDTVNASRSIPVYEVAWDAVTDRSLNPRLAKGDNRLRKALSDEFAKNGYRLESLEEEQRWGCACGETGTDDRLSRQWNLSQADWDGMLIPLRHALSRTDKPNDTSQAQGGAPVWHWSDTSEGSAEDPVGVDGVFGMLETIRWRRFDQDGEADEGAAEIIGPGFNPSLFRLRRLL